MADAFDIIVGLFRFVIHNAAGPGGPGWGFHKPATGQDFFIAPTFIHNPDIERVIGHFGKRDKLTIGRPRGCGIPPRPVCNAGLVPRFQVQNVNLLGAGLIGIERHFFAIRGIRRTGVNRATKRQLAQCFVFQIVFIDMRHAVFNQRQSNFCPVGRPTRGKVHSPKLPQPALLACI